MKNIATMLSLKSIKEIPHLARSLEKVNIPHQLNKNSLKGLYVNFTIDHKLYWNLRPAYEILLNSDPKQGQKGWALTHGPSLLWKTHACPLTDLMSWQY